MLGKLFGSNSRVKILKLFLSHPEEKFYIRQISRHLKLQINSVRRELDNLEKFGLLTSAPIEDDTDEEELVIQTIEDIKQAKIKGKRKKPVVDIKSDKKYYRVNTDFVLYEEIKALVQKAQVLYEKDFATKLNNLGKTKLMILTGFFVNQPHMPIDLLIVGRINKQRLRKLIAELEDDMGREINFTIMDTKEFKYRRDITDVFLYDILEGKKLVVIDDYGIS